MDRIYTYFFVSYKFIFYFNLNNYLSEIKNAKTFYFILFQLNTKNN